MKKIKLYTLGCKSNQYDTQLIRETFLKKGFEESQNGFADVYVVNTCIVTQKAENESKARINKIKKEHPSAELIIAGCLKWNQVDSAGIGELSGKFRNRSITSFAGHKRAFLKIQDGCDNFCSYCIVPYARGKPRSKRPELVKRECSRLIDNGYKEIVITGICLGAYGKDLLPQTNLAELLKELETIGGNFRIRLSSIDPQYISRELIDIIASSAVVCPHLHIPFQSGDDEILRSMRRKYTAGFAVDLIEKIKKKIPDISITTDIIVGFPGEKESNFSNTIKLLEFIKPLKVHTFVYSLRPPTLASGMPQTASAGECKKRTLAINRLQRAWSEDFMARFIGKEISVLAEERICKDKPLFSGYSQFYFKASFESKGDYLNNFAAVKGVKVNPEGLFCAL